MLKATIRLAPEYFTNSNVAYVELDEQKPCCATASMRSMRSSAALPRSLLAALRPAAARL